MIIIICIGFAVHPNLFHVPTTLIHFILTTILEIGTTINYNPLMRKSGHKKNKQFVRDKADGLSHQTFHFVFCC